MDPARKTLNGVAPFGVEIEGLGPEEKGGFADRRQLQLHRTVRADLRQPGYQCSLRDRRRNARTATRLR
jgi:hypothetical protein